MMKRILAFDVGDKRIGVAVSDALGITAQPVETYHRKGAPGTWTAPTASRRRR